MNQSTIDIVKATAPLVAEHAEEITTLFYKTMFINNPEASQFFNKANQSGQQPKALANAIIAYALNIDNLGALGDAVELIASKHCGLQVLPEHYPIVHDNLLIAVAEVLKPAVTPEIGAAWSEAVNFLANLLIGDEATRYAAAEARSGGWRGWKNFTVSEIETMSTGVKTFKFVPEDGVTAPYEFTPGQYLSIRVDVNKDKSFSSPRHYTIVSKPGDSFLQICTKKLDGGVVSSFMHDTLVAGDVVHLSPPFGPFTLAPSTSVFEGDRKKAVLISAGIGRTPMKAFLDSLVGQGVKTVKTVHVDKNQAAVPFYDYFESTNAGGNQYCFTEEGRPTTADIAKALVAEEGADSTFYMCGPTSFMQGMAHGLVANGVERGNVKWEAFSPQMSCPVNQA
jgi:nitric oxide dioxygenase